jgi:excisionase family DNA binding protein
VPHDQAVHRDRHPNPYEKEHHPVSAPTTTANTPTTGRGSRQALTVAEVCAELRISRRTFQEWRAKGRAPRCAKLPNGDLRITRAALDAWWTTCEEAR